MGPRSKTRRAKGAPDLRPPGPPRVGVLTAAFPSPAEPYRARFIREATEALAERVPVTVIAPRVHRRDPLREEYGDRLRVVRFRYPGRGRRLKESAPPLVVLAYLASGFLCCARTLLLHGIDRVLIHWVVPSGWIGIPAARLLRRPAVLYAHGSDLNRYAVANRAVRGITGWVLRQAGIVVAASDALGTIAEDAYRVDPSRVVVLPMGIDRERFRPGDRTGAREELGVSPAARVVLFVGDLIDEKGVGELARAVRILASKEDRIVGAFLGDGPLRKDLSGEGLVAPGPVPPETVALWMRAADLFVLPSRSEGMPVSVLEAQASGTPVVASRVGGIPERIRHGVNGWLLDSTEPEEMAGVLSDLLQDPARSARYAEEGLREPVLSSREVGCRLGDLLLGLGG